ncbi:MAG: PHP domain-containing protein [Candidatus Zixiibacteriota bacterium]
MTDNRIETTPSSPEQPRRTLLFHVHTHFSFDSWMSPELIVAFARKFDIDMVVVTDHDDHRGAERCAEIAGDDGPLFPLAAEYKSTQGDMIAMFLTKPIGTRDPIGIIEETHAQGGLVALPHPYKYSNFTDEIFRRADIIEAFNARTSDRRNNNAVEIARRLGKPTIAGADAHLKRELDRALNEFEAPPDWDWKRVIMDASRTARVKKTTIRNIRASAMISAIKRQRPLRLAKNAVRWLQASSDATP